MAGGPQTLCLISKKKPFAFKLQKRIGNWENEGKIENQPAGMAPKSKIKRLKRENKQQNEKYAPSKGQSNSTNENGMQKMFSLNNGVNKRGRSHMHESSKCIKKTLAKIHWWKKKSCKLSLLTGWNTNVVLSNLIDFRLVQIFL